MVALVVAAVAHLEQQPEELVYLDRDMLVVMVLEDLLAEAVAVLVLLVLGLLLVSEQIIALRGHLLDTLVVVIAPELTGREQETVAAQLQILVPVVLLDTLVHKHLEVLVAPELL